MCCIRAAETTWLPPTVEYPEYLSLFCGVSKSFSSFVSVGQLSDEMIEKNLTGEALRLTESPIVTMEKPCS